MAATVAILKGYLPEEWKAIALAHRVVLQILRTSDLDRTSLCPAGYFEPGQRTGFFRLTAGLIRSFALYARRPTSLPK